MAVPFNEAGSHEDPLDRGRRVGARETDRGQGSTTRSPAAYTWTCLWRCARRRTTRPYSCRPRRGCAHALRVPPRPGSDLEGPSDAGTDGGPEEVVFPLFWSKSSAKPVPR